MQGFVTNGTVMGRMARLCDEWTEMGITLNFVYNSAISQKNSTFAR